MLQSSPSVRLFLRNLKSLYLRMPFKRISIFILHSVLLTGAGSVAFANVVKAGEPLCSVIMGVIIMSVFPSTSQVLTLIPIVAGVMIASMAEVRLPNILSLVASSALSPSLHAAAAQRTPAARS